MSDTDQKTHTFHVKGMHCTACVLLTESELQELDHIEKATSSLTTRTIEVCGDFGDKTREEICRELSQRLEKHGYSLSLEKQQSEKNWSEFGIAIPIAIGFAVLFVLLQKLGIVNLVNTSNVSYGTAFLLGIIASLSTCMAVVGGLVLSMSATFAREGDRVREQRVLADPALLRGLRRVDHDVRPRDGQVPGNHQDPLQRVLRAEHLVRREHEQVQPRPGLRRELRRRHPVRQAEQHLQAERAREALQRVLRAEHLVRREHEQVQPDHPVQRRVRRGDAVRPRAVPPGSGL